MRGDNISTESSIWAITCYFNTSESKQRLKNFRHFQSKLSIPLIAIELSFNGHFDLQDSDANVLIKRQVSDVLWHKERLLNIAIDHIPNHCSAICWLDADIIFTNENWHKQALEALKTSPIIQPYSQYHDLPEFSEHIEDTFSSGPSFCSVVVDKGIEQMSLQDLGARKKDGGFNAGLAWVARTELLKNHHLYDRFILGSADRAMALACMGKFIETKETYFLSDSRYQHYLSWATSFYDEVKSNVGYIQGDVLHLWHGDIDSRKYLQRAQDLVQYDFNPTVDITTDENDCWRWATDKASMHQYFRDYFQSRGM